MNLAKIEISENKLTIIPTSDKLFSELDKYFVANYGFDVSLDNLMEFCECNECEVVGDVLINFDGQIWKTNSENLALDFIDFGKLEFEKL